jgi:hypothetical protein
MSDDDDADDRRLDRWDGDEEDDRPDEGED